MRKESLFKFLLHPSLQLYFFVALALLCHLILWVCSPENSMVVLYKLALVFTAAVLGFAFDYAAFPYARPDSYLPHDWRNDPDADNPENADYPIVAKYIPSFNVACLRRALIIAAFMIAACLGL